MIATKELKMAAKRDVSQARVWGEVGVAQEKLSASVAVPVQSTRSQSSLQLALENDKVQASATDYVEKLSSIVEGQNDVIGFVFAINGKLNSADVYGATWIFSPFWPRLLKTAAIEAVAERTSAEKCEPVSISSAAEFLTASEQGAETIKAVTARTHMLQRESEKSLFFETRDMAHNALWIHRNYLMK